MPYPFIPAITWADFIDRMRGFGVDFKEDDDPSIAWDARQGPFRFFEKGDLFYSVSFGTLQDFIPWSQVRSICDRFGVEPAEFGLDLD